MAVDRSREGGATATELRAASSYLV